MRIILSLSLLSLSLCLLAGRRGKRKWSILYYTKLPPGQTQQSGWSYLVSLCHYTGRPNGFTNTANKLALSANKLPLSGNKQRKKWECHICWKYEQDRNLCWEIIIFSMNSYTAEETNQKHVYQKSSNPPCSFYFALKLKSRVEKWMRCGRMWKKRNTGRKQHARTQPILGPNYFYRRLIRGTFNLWSRLCSQTTGGLALYMGEMPALTSPFSKSFGGELMNLCEIVSVPFFFNS